MIRVITASQINVKEARSAYAWFRRRSWIGQITRDGITKLSLFVPEKMGTNAALNMLQERLPNAHCSFTETP